MATVVEALSPGTQRQLISRTYPVLQFTQQPVVVSHWPSMHPSVQEMSGAVVVEVGSNSCKHNNLTTMVAVQGKGRRRTITIYKLSQPRERRKTRRIKPIDARTWKNLGIYSNM